MSNIEAELAKAEKKVYGNVCRKCNRPIAKGLIVANRDAEGYPECHECAKVVRLDAYGCYVWLSDGALFDAEINDFIKYGQDWEVAVEITAPENQDFLDAVNEVLGSDFRYEQFAGR